MEAFAPGKEPLVDRAHLALLPRPRLGDRPCAIVARLHYYAVCTEIIRNAREINTAHDHLCVSQPYPQDGMGLCRFQ